MERVILQLAACQQESGCRVSILALRGGALEEEARERRVNFRVLSGGIPRRAIQTLQYFRTENPEIVHVHNPTSLHYAVLSKLVSRPAIVMTLHGDMHARIGTQLEWFLTDAIVAVSRAAKQAVRLPASAGSVTVIHNGIEPRSGVSISKEAARQGLANAEDFVGIIVARVDGHKGHRTLLHSFTLIRDAGLNVKLLIVGDGQDLESMQKLAAELRLSSEMVQFLGRRSDIDNLLAASDFFVLPSDTEGLPLSVLEAMSHGLPIIATHVGGLPELIDHGHHGLLVPPGNPHALFAAIHQLESDRELRRALGEATRSRARSEFSLIATVEQYQRLYESIS
jgi:glycosyltransferase involved in cell wall biosynthesis